jgi:SSS family solute:Na+ symporter
VQASNITPVDWAVIGLYFSILLAVAWWVVRQGKDTAADYFLAGSGYSVRSRPLSSRTRP